jgi:CspA family cold shock protein
VEQHQGSVKWFNAVRGYGFITPDAGEEVFVHHTNIVQEGFRKLAQGDRVAFDVDSGPKGPYALRVRKLEDQPS